MTKKLFFEYEDKTKFLKGKQIAEKVNKQLTSDKNAEKGKLVKNVNKYKQTTQIV